MLGQQEVSDFRDRPSHSNIEIIKLKKSANFKSMPSVQCFEVNFVEKIAIFKSHCPGFFLWNSENQRSLYFVTVCLCLCKEN